MSTPARILRMHLSFAWTETFSTLLAGTAPGAPMAFLGNSNDYAGRFEEIRQQMTGLAKQKEELTKDLEAAYSSDPKTLARKKEELKQAFHAKLREPDRLKPPWQWLDRKYIHHFWQYYFGNVEPNKLQGANAWQYVVPLQITQPIRVRSPWPPPGPKCRVSINSLLYPHGIAVVLVLHLSFKGSGSSVSLATIRALEARNSLPFPVTLPDKSQDTLKVDALGALLRNDLRERALGVGASPGDSPPEPITVATVINGRGGDATQPITPNGNLHKALEGLCSWDDQWANMTSLEPLDKANLLKGKPSVGRMVYHLTRGRAVWMPDLFDVPKDRRRRKLGCYHENLTLVTLQTEMLAQVLVQYVENLGLGVTSSPALQDLAKYAAIRLGYLYGTTRLGSKKYTYNSASPRAYLDENGYVDLVNQARESIGLKPSSLTYKEH